MLQNVEGQGLFPLFRRSLPHQQLCAELHSYALNLKNFKVKKELPLTKGRYTAAGSL
jgi:hypothetical protein